MLKKIIMAMSIVGAVSCGGGAAFDPSVTPDAGDKVQRVEPLSWWVGMKTPLQIMVNGDGISAFNVKMEGGSGVKVKEIHKGDSPNYVFIDVAIAPDAVAGDYWLVFSDGKETFKYPYRIDRRTAGSAERGSFTTADMIYLIMPDRFANGDSSNDSTPDTAEKADRSAFFGRHGGDIQGIIDHLDYIADLGATAIWNTPLLLDNEPDGSYHGYACADYYHIDPRFGSNALYKDFVDKAHGKGLKVIMDIVTNHCGTAHWWMKDLPFKDWIHVFPEYTGTNVCFSTNMDPNASKYDLNLQESGWFVPSMPDMNLDNPFTLKYFQQWAVWWIEYSGLDGFRVDTYPYNEKEPMSRWCEAVLNEYPHFNIVGETWLNSNVLISYWQKDSKLAFPKNSYLPTVMDFPLQALMNQAFDEETNDWAGGLYKLYDYQTQDLVYANPMNLLTFFDNHDTARFTTDDEKAKNINRYKQALTFLLTTRGIPQIYYGTEILMTGDKAKGDGDLRKDFPGGWAGDATSSFVPEGRTGLAKEAFDFTRKLLNWRKGNAVIGKGSLKHFSIQNGTYVYERKHNGKSAVVIMNGTDKAQTLNLAPYREVLPRAEAKDFLSGRTVALGETLELQPREILLLEF